MPARKYQTPEIMHDAPLHDHKSADFHFEDFAATLARLVASVDTHTPLTIGINGAWGSGKTSLLWCVKDMLDHPRGADGKGSHRFAAGEEGKFRECKTVWFNAWKYANEEELALAMLRITVQSMYASDNITKIAVNILDPYKKRQSTINSILNWLSLRTPLGDIKFNFNQSKSIPLADSMAGLERLMAPWLHRKLFARRVNPLQAVLIFFIDDLDRCLPTKVVQVLEAIQLFLDIPGCIFFIGADTYIIQNAIERYYQDIGITGESAKDYLEKIIQLRFDLPLIADVAMENYLRAQKKVDKAMLNRWRALIAAAEVNPRRVKSVINDLNLQWVMMVNSGQAVGVDRDDFICWQALMHAAPAAFTRQVLDFEDKSIRFGFIQDALRWQNGKQEDREAVKGFFSAYEDKDSKRLRNVLRQISFSKGFSAETLDAMIYLVAPPAAPKPEPEKLVAEEVKKTPDLEPAGEMAFAEVRAEKSRDTLSQDGNRLVIGGLEFVRVPKGKFIMGSKEDNSLAYDDERPQHTVSIPYDYWIAKFILTNAQFAEFLDKKGHPVSDWQKRKDHPVVNVSWDDALAYCKWFNETHKTELMEAGGLTLRLPSEAEWEKAARGAYGNEWPWGNEFDPSKCNSAEGGERGTTPVGAYSTLGGDSPYGCADMVGNVYEWTSTLFAKYPYVSGDRREDLSSRNRRVVRGSSFSDTRLSGRPRCAYRNYLNPDDHYYNIGFRVCASPPSHI